VHSTKIITLSPPSPRGPPEVKDRKEILDQEGSKEKLNIKA